MRGVTPELFYGNFVSDAEGRLYARGGLRDCLSVWGGAWPLRHQHRQSGSDGGDGRVSVRVAPIMQRRYVRLFTTWARWPNLGIATPRADRGRQLHLDPPRHCAAAPSRRHSLRCDPHRLGHREAARPETLLSDAAARSALLRRRLERTVRRSSWPRFSWRGLTRRAFSWCGFSWCKPGQYGSGFAMIPAALKKAAAFGTGVGIQITGPPGAESLHIAAVRVRRSVSVSAYSPDDVPSSR